VELAICSVGALVDADVAAAAAVVVVVAAVSAGVEFVMKSYPLRGVPTLSATLPLSLSEVDPTAVPLLVFPLRYGSSFLALLSDNL
jgi:hypothetical protein